MEGGSRESLDEGARDEKQGPIDGLPKKTKFKDFHLKSTKQSKKAPKKETQFIDGQTHLPLPPGGRKENDGPPKQTFRRFSNPINQKIEECNYRFENVAQRFEAEFMSFNDLMALEPHPDVRITDVFDRLMRLFTSSNFQWSEGNDSLELSFQLIIWFAGDSTMNGVGVNTKVSEDQIQHEQDHATHVKTRFVYVRNPQDAVAAPLYLLQPILPLVAVRAKPKDNFRHMFYMDPRSYYTFKFAWRKFLNFGVSDYRSVIGEKLAHWTGRCKALVDKPIQGTYWLLLMIGSYYRESLAAEGNLPSFAESQPVSSSPLIHVDSLTSLQTLLFSSDRQILFAGLDPSVPYVDWLRFIADQFSYRQFRRENNFGRLNEIFGGATPRLSVFETNEFLDLNTCVVYFGRLQLKKATGGTQNSWRTNPEIIKNFIMKYAEDNLITSQVDYAIRLYTYCSAFGIDIKNKEEYCWNGMQVCEIGIPMPSTCMSFLSYFVNPEPYAISCPKHRHRKHVVKKKKEARDNNFMLPVISNKKSSFRGEEEEASPGAFSQEESSYSESESSEVDEEKLSCTCTIYIPKEYLKSGTGTNYHQSNGLKEKAGNGDVLKTKNTDTDKVPPEIIEKKGKIEENKEKTKKNINILPELAEFTIMHSFVGVLHAGLNVAKQVIRLHFSIGPQAYNPLPLTAEQTEQLWKTHVMPWYETYMEPDVFQRSQYSVHLEGILRAILGDGFTSGYRMEVLDCLCSPEDCGTYSNQPTREASLLIPEEVDLMEDAGRISNYEPKTKFSFAPEDEDSDRKSVYKNNQKKKKKVDKPKNIKRSTTLPARVNSFPDLVGLLVDVETISFMNLIDHFSDYHQWCHSGQIVPFLQRVYERSGVSGLVPRYRNKQLRPPLVLPTMSHFCYGHCYKMSSVFEYFYGGMRTIHISSRIHDLSGENLGYSIIQAQSENDLQVVDLSQNDDESDEEYCDVGPAQINKQLNRSHTHSTSIMNRGAAREKSRTGSVDVKPKSKSAYRRIVSNQELSTIEAMKRQTELVLKKRSCPAVYTVSKKIPDQLYDSTWLHVPGMASTSSNNREPLSSTTRRMTAVKRLTRGFKKAGTVFKFEGLKKQVAGTGQTNIRRILDLNNIKPGILHGNDPFFWFLQGTYSCYPPLTRANQAIVQSHQMTIYYRDNISDDEGEPEEECTRKGLENTNNMGEASWDQRRCHETTDLAPRTERKELDLVFCDENNLILGDEYWWPGAVGYKYTHEVSTDDASSYVKGWTFPRAQLLYQYTHKLSEKEYKVELEKEDDEEIEKEIKEQKNNILSDDQILKITNDEVFVILPPVIFGEA